MSARPASLGVVLTLVAAGQVRADLGPAAREGALPAVDASSPARHESAVADLHVAAATPGAAEGGTPGPTAPDATPAPGAGSASSGAPLLGHVTVTSQGNDAERRAFLASLGEQLGRLGVALHPGEAGAPPPTRRLASLEVELRDGEDAALTLHDGAGRLVLYRRLARSSSPAVLVETTALAAQSAIEELVLAPEKRAARVVVAPKVERPAAAPVPLLDAPVVDRSELGLQLELSAALAARLLGGGAPMAPGVSVGVALAYRGERWRPSLGLTVGLHPRFEVPSELLMLRTDLLALRLVPSFDVFTRGPFRVDAGLGGGADLFVGVPLLSTMGRGVLARPSLAVAGLATLTATGHLVISREFDAFLGLALDVDLAPVRFVATTNGAREELFEPQRFRPGLVVGVTWGPRASTEVQP